LELTAKISMTIFKILLLHRKILAVASMVLQAQISVIDHGKSRSVKVKYCKINEEFELFL
jgi:hypothetical protein